MKTLIVTRRPLAWSTVRFLWPIIPLVVACQGDGLQSGLTVDENKLYWDLELNHRAVTLSVPELGYDTLTLVATPRTADGTVLAGAPAVHYVSNNPDQVAVTTDGVLHALRTTSGNQLVTVTATLTMGNLKHIDTVVIKVVSNPAPLPQLDSFSIHPAPPDSAKIGVGSYTTCFRLPIFRPDIFCSMYMPVTVLDKSGVPIPNVPVSILSSDRDAIRISTVGRITTPINNPNVVPGASFNLYASTTIFGIRKVDTLPLRIGWPVLLSLPIGLPAGSGNNGVLAMVGKGAAIDFRCCAGIRTGGVDLTFDDPDNVAAVDQNQPPSFIQSLVQFGLCSETPITCGVGGNIMLDSSPINQLNFVDILRVFPKPGVYNYHSTALGYSGRIVVVED